MNTEGKLAMYGTVLLKAILISNSKIIVSFLLTDSD